MLKRHLTQGLATYSPKALLLAKTFLLPKTFLVLVVAFLTNLCAAQVAIPGKVQAESFTGMAGVQLENTTDTGGGQNVGWIDTNDWMTYSINPSTTGWYKVEYRVASTSASGQIVLSQNAKDVSAVTSVPNTGGWQSWTTVTSRVYLSRGVQSLSIFAKAGGFNINWVNLTAEVNNSLPAIKQSGHYWVDASGNRVHLRGTNLGNWLQLEFWMMNESMSAFGNKIGDQCTLEGALAGRFGNAEKERLMKVFRDSWITTRDFDYMKGMGMNVVRIPFLYSVVEDEYNPYNLRPDAWQYLDWAVNEAEKRGMYVILDLHGTVGGQAAASEQHDGCVGPAQLWTSATYRDRTKWLWDKVASHYAGRTAIAAYDLLNEPWGTDATTLANFSYELFNVVRAKDANHVILLPGHNSGIDAYGNPNSRGLTNVSMWMHFYPGLWGWNDTATYGAGQANMYSNWLHCNAGGVGESCDWNNKIAALGTPFLVGEFQPWTMLGSYGGQMTRKAYDIFNQYGWAATNWAYKSVSFSGSNGDTSSWAWGMVTNSSNGGALGTIDISSASIAQIESYFRQFATQPLVRNENIAYWMNWKPTVGNRIEAEMFAYHGGMRMETTADAGGGFNVSYIDNNDWMSYPINVPTTGNYNLQFRVATAYAGGQFTVRKGASDLVTVTVPNTGGWQNWVTINSSVYLTAGQQDLVIYSKVGGWNINWWQLTAQ